jgi:hypothetical protein
MPTPTYQDVLFRSGDLFLPKDVRNFLEYYYIGNNKSTIYVTNWSIIHFLTGILVARYLLKKRMNVYEIVLITFIVHTIWELWQIYGENTPIGTLRGQIDVLVDTLFYMAGVGVMIWSRVARK